MPVGPTVVLLEMTYEGGATVEETGVSEVSTGVEIGMLGLSTVVEDGVSVDGLAIAELLEPKLEGRVTPLLRAQVAGSKPCW